MRKITVGESIGFGLATSLLVGFAFGLPTFWVTDWIWMPLHLPLAIIVGGAAAVAVFKGGMNLISIPANYEGVATRFGAHQTGAIYTAGDHWGFPGISGALPVDMRHRRIDLVEKFSALAGDASDVDVDGFLLVKAENPVRVVNVEDVDESMREVLETRIRFFTSMISRAENAVKFKDLLADYLELEPPNSPEVKAVHRAYRARLLAMDDDNFVKGDKTAGIDALMAEDEAGALKRLLHDWGYKVEEAEIEQFNVPQAVKDANLKKATEQALMDAEKIRNQTRQEMIDKLVSSGVNPNNALNSVDLLLGLNVKKDVREITITDLDKVASAFGGQIAGVLKQWLDSHRP